MFLIYLILEIIYLNTSDYDSIPVNNDGENSEY